jgi:hypothetical protein
MNATYFSKVTKRSCFLELKTVSKYVICKQSTSYGSHGPGWPQTMSSYLSVNLQKGLHPQNVCSSNCVHHGLEASQKGGTDLSWAPRRRICIGPQGDCMSTTVKNSILKAHTCQMVTAPSQSNRTQKRIKPTNRELAIWVIGVYAFPL